VIVLDVVLVADKKSNKKSKIGGKKICNPINMNLLNC